MISGTRITNIVLCKKTNLNFRFLRALARSFGIISLLGISACTSSDSSPSLLARPTINDALSSAALTETETTSETDTTLATKNSQTELSPQSTQASVPVPVTSPKYQTSLLAEDNPLGNKPASSDIIADKINSKTVPTTSPIQSGNATNQPATQAITVENAQITAQSAATPNTGIRTFETASIAKKEPKRKLNFFERLLKSRRDKIAAKQLADQKRTLNAEVSKLSKSNSVTNNSNLQSGTQSGVKEGIKLLEVEEGANHDDDTSVELASVGALGRSAGPHGLILQTQGVQVACLKPKLLDVLKKVERRFGKKVMVTSGYRSPARNRRAGGVKNSHHTTCNAADIQIDGISKWNIAKYLRSISGRGGVGTYCRTKSVHVDIGSQRDWHQPCRRRKRRK